MADTIQIRAGNKANMPTLADRELVYVRDENALYVGTPAGNKEIHAELRQTVAAQGKTLTEHGTAIAEQKSALEGKLSASPVAAQAAVAEGADLAAVTAALNALIAAMKGSGVMNT